MSVLNSISFVTGPLGSGKSYFAARHIRDYGAASKVVATNFPLIGNWWRVMESARPSSRRKASTPRDREIWMEGCRERVYRFDVMDELYDFRLPGTGEDRGLLVLDEGGLNLNARLYQQRSKRDKDVHSNPIASLQFYINMRKRGWTCLILAHSSEHLDNQVRDMGGGLIKLRNLARVKLPVLGISLAKKPRFIARYFTPDISSTKPEFREVYGLDPKIASIYRSMDEFEFMPDSRGVRLQRPGSLVTTRDGLDGWCIAERARREAARERVRPETPSIEVATRRGLPRVLARASAALGVTRVSRLPVNSTAPSATVTQTKSPRANEG